MVGAEQPSSVLGFSCSKSPQSAVFLGLKTSWGGWGSEPAQVVASGTGKRWPSGCSQPPNTGGGVVAGLWDPHQRWGSGFICP